jgi:hypothetical protein
MNISTILAKHAAWLAGCSDGRHANLRHANLRGANLTHANLRGAYLTHANLTDANLTRAYLTGANLTGANLTGADLAGAYLPDANLTRADLAGADLTGAYLPAFAVCPEVGAFVAFKKLRGGLIATLEIPAGARRTSSLVGRKCRAEFAKVLEISDGAMEGVSVHSDEFIYRVGEVVRPDSYSDDIRVECAPGIHFFITRAEAENY